MGTPQRSVIVMDNGADTCKVGFGGQAKPLKAVPNCAVRTKKEKQWIIGHQQEAIQDHSGLYYRRPHDRGYVTDWDLQTQIWTQIFGPSLLRITPPDCTLLLTEPLFNPAPLRRQQDQVVFETFGFHSYHRSTAASLALRGYQYEIQSLFGKPCALIVDIGYSFTHVVPMYNYVPVYEAVRRVDVGGKLLSNWLKDVVSYRHINLHDDVYLINDIKEKMCSVSPHFLRDLEQAGRHRKLNHLTKQYLLPNHVTTHVGSVLDAQHPSPRLSQPQQAQQQGGDDVVISMSNELIATPELLFHPSDIGLNQQGIADAIVDSIAHCGEYMHALLYEHIIVLGGSSLFDGLVERLESEVRMRAPSEYRVSIRRSKEALTTAWCGGSCLSIDPSFSTVYLTKRDYEEHGDRILRERFTDK